MVVSRSSLSLTTTTNGHAPHIHVEQLVKDTALRCGICIKLHSHHELPVNDIRFKMVAIKCTCTCISWDCALLLL